MPYLTPEQCVQLHYAMMADELEALQAQSDKIEVCYFDDEANTDDERDEFRSFLNEEIEIPFLTYPQRGDDIWEKMRNAFEDSFAREAGSKILVGCDIPGLNSDIVHDAFSFLSQKDYVCNPTLDGGYYLIGMNEFKPELFDLKNDIKKQGCPLRDCDTPFELLNTQGNLTKQFVKNLKYISVIVPVYNESTTIDKCMERLKGVEAEVLFVDGNSTDDTVTKICNGGFLVVGSEKGRANQMNYGAKCASSDNLFFLHADSIPPKGFEHEVLKTLKKTNWGCFGIKFDSHDPLMKICQIISNNRIHDRKVVFGDQGIFIKRKLFEEIGGFPDLPIMEDYQLSLTLKGKGEKIGVAKGLITTSARRYKPGHRLSIMWKMNRLRKQYRDGVDINEIAAQYKDIR